MLGSVAARMTRGAWDTALAYFRLTKPRIIVLLLITTIPAMILAEGGWPSPWLVLATGGGGFLILEAFANLLAALLTLGAFAFYVVVYTLLLKRTTPLNIVIGGAAGAMPPVVGWAAVTGSVEAPALVLFAIVVLWTPPHDWALALNYNSDYRRAGVPMLP